jgi:hypothetical protein
VVWGVDNGDGKFIELAGGEEALSSGKESSVFNDKGGDGDRDKGMGAFDDDGRVKGEVGVSDDGRGREVGVFDEGGAEEVGVFDERGGRETEIFDDKGEVGVSDNGGGEEAGVSDEAAVPASMFNDDEGLDMK